MTAFINSSLNPRGANDKTVNVWLTIFSPVPTIRKPKRLFNVSSVIVLTQICLVTISLVMKSKKAFEIYNEDIDKAHKTYASYNLPSVYALMLTNKDSVTRVYYGDLYLEDGHYMAKRHLTLMPSTPSCVLVSSM